MQKITMPFVLNVCEALSFTFMLGINCKCFKEKSFENYSKLPEINKQL